MRRAWAELGREDRLHLGIVALVGCALIALETISFQTLVYVNEYLPATQVIAVALMGIALGGLLSFFVPATAARGATAVLTLLYPLALLASFPVIIRLNPTPLAMLPLLTLPYVIASLIISIAFNRLRPSLVYLCDLGGAGLGAVVAVLAIPPLREEGSFFLLGLLGALPAFLAWRLVGRLPQLVGGTLIAAGAAALLVAHLVADPFNLVFTATADPAEFPGKIFMSEKIKRGVKAPGDTLIYSRGSLIERIDIEAVHTNRGSKWSRFYYRTWYNGRANDHVSRDPKKTKGRLDRRMPTRLKLGEDPDTLLVGPAAEGLTKTVKALGNGHIDAVEINPAVAELMLDELWEFSARAYAGMDLTIGDARTFLERTDRKYDFITLLNTHRIRTVGHQGPPEYCHTLEAMTAYFEHLTEHGFVVFEERNVNARADLGIRRILRTIMAALGELGAANPADHLVVYEFPKLKNMKRWPPANRYTMVMAGRSPVTDAERAKLLEWGEQLEPKGKQPPAGRYARGVVFQYLPGLARDNYWTETIAAADIYAVGDIDPAIHEMSVVTDDRPFPYDVLKAREKPWEILRQIALLSLIMVLLPTVATFVGRRRGAAATPAAGGTALVNLLLVLYFAALGIAYLLVEIVLMQRFQMFLSSPVYSIVVVLGTMLVASGIGGYFSGRATRRRALVALALVVALVALYYFVLGPLLGALMFLPFALRVVAAMVLIAPLAFLMGVPFPYALALAKARLSERHAGLFFGINGAVGAVATPLAIILSMTHGFGFTLLVGAAAYLVALALLAPLGSAARTP